MRALVQRALDASVSVDGATVGQFEGPGLVVLVGVTHGDDVATAQRLAEKVLTLRIFDGPTTEASAADLGHPLLVISQFTLYGQTRKGRRPTWEAAAPASHAEPLVDTFVVLKRDEVERYEAEVDDPTTREVTAWEVDEYLADY